MDQAIRGSRYNLQLERGSTIPIWTTAIQSAARLAVESEKSCKNWASLKAFLTREFETKISARDLHQKLSREKRKVGETLLEFAYRMKAFTNYAAMDEESLIDYIIKGIADEPTHKVILYGAETFDDLKDKIKADEKMCNVNPSPKTKVGQVHRQPKAEPRCYNCGEKGHRSDKCPHKSKGIKCFKCGGFGHIAPNCKSAETKREINRVSTRDMNVLVLIDSIPEEALVDTGSDVTIIKKSIYDKLPSKPRIEPTLTTLTGL